MYASEPASADAIRSFVDVLPTEPVTPITAPDMRPRAVAPTAASASRCRVDEDRGRLDVRPRTALAQIGRRPGGDRGSHEVVTIAIGHDRHEQLSRDQRTRVSGRAVDGDIVTDDGAVCHQRDL